MTDTDNSADAELPTVAVDTTLSDLYRQAGPAYSDKPPRSRLINRKYIYQDGPFTSNNGEPNSEKEVMATAIKYLSLITQRDTFICGAGPIISDPSRFSVKTSIRFLIKEAEIDFLACKVVSDDLERCNNVVPLETHWYLNSKRALADSSLPTPKCIALTIDGFSVDAQSCCAICIRYGLDSFVIPADCTGARGIWLQEQSQRIYKALKYHALPLVLKNQATFGGAGTFIVKTEEERQKIVDELGKGFLSRLLSSVNADNLHLEPATMLLSDLIQDPVGDYGITFFVNEKGRRPVFLGVSKQMIEDGTAWVGSIIDYRQQSELREKFDTLLNRISDWLQSYGYIGPAGADILEDTDGFHVVDLNIRTTGSLRLPLLQTHFTSRGLNVASSFSIDVQQRRDDFSNMYKSEFQEGRVCIVSWYEDEETGSSLTELVIGGEDDAKLKRLMDRVKENSNSVTF
ncbi:solid-state culture specific ATP-grasp domain-containing protein [Fusarium austroafricanum]|uniref:Solid-state culture specific ATP-grasp domain-containing protein n=1 Tax=Fusarium austroafricanum TaxID=2364996 RepID=A0A8H4NX79_9HYPO|nr:solid-state culture specific ATP-grasp domain-containing protein [Fusarium austroafricanum]